MSTHNDEFDRTTRFSGGQFDGSGFSAGSGFGNAGGGVAVDDGPEGFDDDQDQNQWHGGLDFGLLVLRLALGGIFVMHGLQKLFGLFDGPGIGGFADMLGDMGYTSQTTLLSWITGIAELGGGALLILGLFTPLGAAAILGVAVNIVFAKWDLGAGLLPTADAPVAFEYEALLGAVAFALLFTGAGRASIDKNTPWRRKPLPFALLGLALAAAASVVVILLFR